jgi:ubiquinone/menaquinone biosynthesis C-methylase UbiE
LCRQFPEFSAVVIRGPDLLADVESLSGIQDESEDFVIANHVLEHVEDPLKALKSVARVLRPQGIFYFALPDKRHSFDRTRSVTPLAHLLADHNESVENSRRSHYEEWIRCVDGLAGDEAAAKLDIMLRGAVTFISTCGRSTT